MDVSVFDHRDYKRFLNEVQRKQPRKGHGFRSKMATAIGCQVSYVSQVLSGPGHFNLEQADRINLFLGRTGDEARYFLFLVELARAGTPTLRAHFRRELEL